MSLITLSSSKSLWRGYEYYKENRVYYKLNNCMYYIINVLYNQGFCGIGNAIAITIDNSSYCVIYYDENYMPLRRKSNKRDLFDYQPNSGTKRAYDYAVKKGLQTVNLK